MDATTSTTKSGEMTGQIRPYHKSKECQLLEAPDVTIKWRGRKVTPNTRILTPHASVRSEQLAHYHRDGLRELRHYYFQRRESAAKWARFCHIIDGEGQE